MPDRGCSLRHPAAVWEVAPIAFLLVLGLACQIEAAKPSRDHGVGSGKATFEEKWANKMTAIGVGVGAFAAIFVVVFLVGKIIECATGSSNHIDGESKVKVVFPKERRRRVHAD